MSNNDFSFYKNKKILVTGGAGFVGSNIVHHLSKYSTQVIVIDNFHKDYGANEFNLDGTAQPIRLIRGDITDRTLMNSVMNEGIDYVFHGAAQCSHVDSMIDPWLDLKFNCEGTLTLLEAVKTATKAKKNKPPLIIYIGTRAVIGAPLETPATEKTVPNPVDVYGVNKLASEYYGSVYARVHKIPFVSLRLTNSFGPRHQMKHGKYGILNWFMSLALQKGTIKVFGSGEQLRDYLYIDDAVEAALKAGLCIDSVANGKIKINSAAALSGSEIPFLVFNLASGRPQKFVDCAKKIIEIVPDGKLEMVPWPPDRKAIETGDFVADSSEAHRYLNWLPKVTFEDGLKMTAAYYREHLKKYL